MKIHLLSLNVRGLNEDAAVDTVQAYIRDMRPTLDIVAIQEHKVRGLSLTQVTTRLWRQAKAFGLEASVGYGHNPLGAGAGCGGLITMLHPRWTRMVSANGALLENRAQWFILHGLPGGDLGVANIYAPNDSPSRCVLWETMARELPQTCRWILLGDFNMVEYRADKSCQSATMVPSRERTLFDAMKVALRVADNPRSPGSLKYSWDNNRQGEHHSLARLDMIYLFEATPGLPDRSLLSYCIKGDLARSDHHPVLASIQLEAQPRRLSHWKMSEAWLDEAAPEITRLWQAAAPGSSFFSKMRRIIRYYKGFCKSKAQANRAGEDGLIRKLEVATREAQDSPDDMGLTAKRGECRIRLEEFQSRKIAGRRIRARIRWKHRGDHISKEFFAAVRERGATTSITALKDGNGA